VIYPASLVPEGWRTWYALNPMVGVVEGFRKALLKTDSQSDFMIVPSVLVAGLVLVSGLYFFRRTEQTIADAV
jgi:lipopolysaccharide transport system permease protein